MSVLVVAAVALVPLLITPGLLFYFDVTPKVVVLLLAGAASVLWMAWNRAALPALLATRRGRWLAALLAVCALSLAIATAASTNPPLSVVGVNWRRFGLIPQLALLLFTLAAAAWLAVDRHRARLLLRVIVAAGLPIALYGILQYFGWDPFLPASGYHIGEGTWTIVRPPGTLGHAAYLATYLLYVVFAGVGLLLTEPRAGWRLLGIAAAVAGSLAVILSGTRAAILALLAGAALLIVWLRPRITLRALTLALTAAAALAAFYYSPPGLRMRARTRWYLEDPRGGARLYLWRDSLRMAADRWWVGHGPETFSAAFPRYQSAALARAYPDFYHESPHNIFLDAFVTQGVIGMMSLLGLAALGFWAAWQGRSAEPRRSAALGVMLAAPLFSQQFTSFIAPTALYFYLTVALALSLRREVSRPSAELRGRLGLAAALPLAALLSVYAVRLLVADRHLALVDHHLRDGDVGQAVAVYARARRWQPRGASADLWYSRSLASFAEKPRQVLPGLQAWQQALAAAARAPQTAEDPHNAYYNLAAFCAAQNDYACTEKSLRSAIAASPTWFKPHWTLAQALRAAGRIEEAEAEARLAADLNGGKNPEVACTLDEIRSAARSR